MDRRLVARLLAFLQTLPPSTERNQLLTQIEDWQCYSAERHLSEANIRVWLEACAEKFALDRQWPPDYYI